MSHVYLGEATRQTYLLIIVCVWFFGRENHDSDVERGVKASTRYIYCSFADDKSVGARINSSHRILSSAKRKKLRPQSSKGYFVNYAGQTLSAAVISMFNAANHLPHKACPDRM